jgi:hypothetical protein
VLGRLRIAVFVFCFVACVALTGMYLHNYLAAVFLAFATSLVAAAVPIKRPWTFGLRTMLIATALIAVALGMYALLGR